jgi:hypothetical protein
LYASVPDWSYYVGNLNLTGVLELDNTDASYFSKAVSGASNPLRIFQNTSGRKPGFLTLGDSTWLVTNVEWNAATNLWIPVDVSYHASAIEINSESTRIYKTNRHKVNYALGWALRTWDSSYIMGERADDISSTTTHSYAGKVSGSIFERAHYSFGSYGPVGVSAYLIGYIPINYRNRRTSAPTWDAIVPASASPTIFSVTYHHADEWGGFVSFTTESRLWSGDLYYLHGTINFYG